MKNIFPLLLILVALSSFATNENTDTTIVIRQPKNVAILESPDSVSVNVTEADGSGTVITRQISQGNVIRSHRDYRSLSLGTEWDIVSGGLMFGFVDGVGAPASARLEMGKSFEIGWLNILAVSRKLSNRSHLSLGVGIDWRNYRSTKGTLFVPADGKVSIGSFAPDVNPRFSRLKVFSLQFPLMYTYNFITKGKNILSTMSVGAIFNWNSHASVKSSWRMADGSTATTSCNDVGQRKFSIDFMAKLTLCEAVGVYVRYSPYKVLTSAISPSFSTLSSGLIFFY